MIVIDNARKSASEALMPSGSSSQVPPPSFEDAVNEDNHLLIDLSHSVDAASYAAPDFDEPPPEFTPYEAEHFDIGSGNIVSHDSHLNTDGEALYRFLLSQAQSPPRLSLHCRGTHSETRHRHVTHLGDNGRTHTRRESYTETVCDFDFIISVDKYIQRQVTHWSVPDSDPAYRGRMVRETSDGIGQTRRVKHKDKKAYSKWAKQRDTNGIPPWVSFSESMGALPTPDLDASVLRSSKSLRAWADDYCASPKRLKEFVYVKTIYGWNLAKLETAVRTSITGGLTYHGELTVEFEKSANKVYIRPDNRLSRALSNKWLKVLSIILLIFPFIWLYKRFNKRGGGRWEVCGGAYALKRMVPVRPEEELIDSKVTSAGSSSQNFKMVGSKELEWMREWESTISRAVAMRYQSSIPVTKPFSETVNAAVALLDDCE